MTTHPDPQHCKQQTDVYLHCRNCDAVFLDPIELLHHEHAHEPKPDTEAPENTMKKDGA